MTTIRVDPAFIKERPVTERTTWSIALDDSDSYWKASEHTVNVLYSETGRWGVRFSGFDLALVGAWGDGASSFRHHFGIRETDVADFIEAYGPKMDALPVLRDILEFVES